MKNQHIRYVPKKRINFNLVTPDGRLALVYKSEKYNVIGIWTLLLGSALPAALIAPSFAPAQYLLYTYSAIFLPAFYGIFDQVQRRRLRRKEVSEVFLYENGEQLLFRTHDNVLHKINILQNDTHRLDENKDKSLIFIVENSGREYYI